MYVIGRMPQDLPTEALSRLTSTLAEDAIFAVASSLTVSRDILDSAIKRRGDAHTASFQKQPVAQMTELDAWTIEMTRVMAPIAPPVWLPMADVLREKVTLEVGARGLRSIFSSKPSDKDVQRVKRLGTLAVRVLRAVLAADGPIDAEEARTISGVVGSLGLPEADALVLRTEAPVAIESMDVYGELEVGVSRGLVRGAWLAAALDSLDPREEQLIRTLASKHGIGTQDVEMLKDEAIALIARLRAAGLAAIDAIRFVLADRVPGAGIQLAANVGTLLLPRRYREEALAQVAQGAPVVLAKRHAALPSDDRAAVIGIAWAAALQGDPSLARRALLRARVDRFAADMGEQGGRVRPIVEAAIDEALAAVATGMP